MNKYLRFVIEIFAIFVVLTVYFIKVVIPEYRNNLGSSDKYLIVNNYVNYIEINLDDKIEFAFLINEKGNVFHMFFFDKNASCLYNKNIENNSINEALEMIFTILKDKDFYNEQSTVKIYHTSNEFYSNTLAIIKKYISNVDEVKIDLKEIAMMYSINSSNDKTILFDLDVYSKELMLEYVDNNSSWQNNNNKWFIYADEVYEKISEYVKEKNIVNMRKDEVNYPISLIPEDSMTYYPTTNSWYYIKDGHVYAFIEFSNNNMNYSYCYQGSIDDKTKGMCE